MKTTFFLPFVALWTACGGGTGKTSTGFSVENAPLHAVAGDTLLLTPVETFSDGSTAAVPAGSTIVWSGVPTVTALVPEASGDSPIPAFGTSPTAYFLTNPARPDQSATLTNRLIVADAGSAGGSVTITGTLGGAATGTLTATIAVAATPAGDAKIGASIYAAACAECHGDTGHGSVANSDGSFTIDAQKYDFPAPGLNAEDGNAGGDPDWSAATFALAARTDVDDGGVALRLPMPNWLSETNPTTQATLSTQDFADIFAFMQTQTR